MPGRGQRAVAVGGAAYVGEQLVNQFGQRVMNAAGNYAQGHVQRAGNRVADAVRQYIYIQWC